MSGFGSEPAVSVRRDSELDQALVSAHGPDWAQTRKGIWVIGRDQKEAKRAGERLSILGGEILPELAPVEATGPEPDPSVIRRLASSSILAVIYAPELDVNGTRKALDAASMIERYKVNGGALPRVVATPASSVVGVPRISLTTGDGEKRPSVKAIVEGFDAGPDVDHLDWDLMSVDNLRSGVILALHSIVSAAQSGTSQTPAPVNSLIGNKALWPKLPGRGGSVR